MNCEEFLNLGGTDLAAVLAHVDRALELGEGELLLAVGSLAENMGTSKSDFDLLWITERTAEQLPADEHIPFWVGRCLVDVHVWPLREFTALVDRFDEWVRTPWSVMHPARFSLDERTLLHRLIHGRILHAGRREQISARMPARGDLAKLRLQVARHVSRTIQVDLAGYRELEDYRTLTFAAQELLGHAVDALLASHELTNPLVKWRSRLLDALPADWEQVLAVRPSGASARDRMWQLHRAPARAQRRAVLEHAFAISTFARAVFLAAELALVKQSAPKPKGAGFRPGAGARRERALPCLDLDVDFSLGDRRVAIGRLNDLGQAFEVGAREAELVVLFDGHTTPREAERIIEGVGGRQSGAKVLQRLVAHVEQAGFGVQR